MAPKEEITTALMNQKLDTAIRKYLGSLAQKADIKDYRAPKSMPPMQMMGMPPSDPGPAPKR